MNEIKNFIKNLNKNYEKLIYGDNFIIIQPTEQEQNEISIKSIYHSKEKNCIVCNSKFDYGQSRKIICNVCKIYTKCTICNKVFELNLNNYSGTKQKIIIDSIINSKKLYITCSKSCSNMNRFSFGTCPNCLHENVKIYNNRCEYCFNKELNKSIICPIHGEQKLSFGGKCIICHNQTDKMRSQQKNLQVL